MRALPIGLLASLALAPAAIATQSPTKSPRLWATINICDTQKAPDTVGVRVSMPGSGKRRERMYARVRLEYFDTTSESWTDLGDGADSGWIGLGSATFVRRETGWNQKLVLGAGQEFRIRGVVRYEWRTGSTVVRKAQRRTAARLGTVLGSDPRGYSATECVLTGP